MLRLLAVCAFLFGCSSGNREVIEPEPEGRSVEAAETTATPESASDESESASDEAEESEPSTVAEAEDDEPGEEASESADAEEDPAADGTPAASGTAEVDLDAIRPENATEEAPAEYEVLLDTTAGEIRIQVTRAWAPNGADRFYNLVKLGYFNDTAFFRVINGFMAQVGMHGDPEVNGRWQDAAIPDDPVTQSNTPGMVTFAARGTPNSRTTQFFINMGNNAYLDAMRFAPFGRTRDMDVVRRLHDGYGEGAPRGRGPSQGAIAAQGNEYLRESFPELDYIRSARVVEE